MEQVQVNQSAKVDQKPIQTKSEIEKIEEETPPEDELLQLKKQLEEERKEKLSLQEKNKDLSVRLTKEQQVRAEFERFHTATLPKLNKAMKSFDEEWQDEPERAVETKIKREVEPVTTELMKLKAITWFNQAIARNPTFSKYQTRVMELADIFPAHTHSELGIDALFKMARAEDLEKENEALKTNKKDEQEKERTFTEPSSPRSTPETKNSKVRLDAAQQEVAEKLGISPEAYAKYIGKVNSA